jgi:hypothetical protein
MIAAAQEAFTGTRCLPREFSDSDAFVQFGATGRNGQFVDAVRHVNLSP